MMFSVNVCMRLLLVCVW